MSQSRGGASTAERVHGAPPRHTREGWAVSIGGANPPRGGRVAAGGGPVDVSTGPLDRAPEAVLKADGGLEAELLPRLRGAAEATAGVIPGASRRDLELGVRVREAQDGLSQLADRGLDAGGEVVDVAGRAVGAAAEQ